MTLALFCAVAGAARAGEPPAKAAPVEMTTEARAHYERGLALYGDKDYAGAIRELEAGYAISARREFLFAEAQALRLSGDCKSAVPLYQKFLASEPEEVQVNATHIGLSRCAEQMARGAAPEPAVQSGAAITPRPAGGLAATRPSPSPPAPWYHDVAGGALLGAGVLGLATGTVFTFAALSARDDANQAAQSYPAYLARWNTARERSHVAVAAFASGAVFTGVAIFRYLRVARRSVPAPAGPASAMAAWAAPAGHGGGVAGIEGRF